MPAIVFTFVEVFDVHFKLSLSLSGEILKLSDLEKKPLDPGESVAARHHKIAKLGKQLAEAVSQLDAIITAHVERAASHVGVTPDPPKPEAN